MLRHLTILLVVVSGVSAAPPARFGRIDVRDVRVSPGAQFLDVHWRGEGMAETEATAQARVREAWREVWIKVVPERDVQLKFCKFSDGIEKIGVL